MASTRRGPGAGSTEASEKTAPLKSATNDSQRTRGTQRKSRGRVSTRAYGIYEGRQLLGRVVLDGATNQALVWIAAGRFLGRFEGDKAAAQAIDIDIVSERKTAAALLRLGDPNPPFVTGLPEHFLRRG
jgi:hypothetical protein